MKEFPLLPTSYLNIGGFVRKSSLLALILVLMLVVRGIALEYGDLIDPTETRYATIAQNMLLSGDWITPRLQTETGLEPYLSKPPLHYWLTALSYKIFGIDEWTARLPSFLGMVLIVASILAFTKRFFNPETGYIAAVICITSPLMFVLSGSSTVDVTFAAFVNCALVAFAIGVSRRENLEGTRITSFAFFIFSALAFLTKGPAGLMLIALPICAFCLIEKNLACLRTLNWWIGTILFCAISVPWFYLVEKAVPGSNWYFFVHENFLRFLVKDYGGRHGAAHVHSYGYIWLMLLISIFPWSALLVRDLFFSAKSFSSFKYNSETRWPIYALFCGLAPMVFFTFARSILPAYVLPGIPGLSIFLGYVIYEISLPQSKISISRFSRGYYPNTAVLASSMVVVMLAGLLVAMPFIEPNKSASAILEVIADESRGTDTVVGVTTANNYSPFWTSGAYEQELSRPLKIAFADQSDLRNAKFKNLIVRDGEAYNFLNEHRESYREVASRGKWRWYTRNTQATN